MKRAYRELSIKSKTMSRHKKEWLVVVKEVVENVVFLKTLGSTCTTRHMFMVVYIW